MSDCLCPCHLSLSPCPPVKRTWPYTFTTFHVARLRSRVQHLLKIFYNLDVYVIWKPGLTNRSLHGDLNASDLPFSCRLDGIISWEMVRFIHHLSENISNHCSTRFLRRCIRSKSLALSLSRSQFAAAWATGIEKDLDTVQENSWWDKMGRGRGEGGHHSFLVPESGDL